jgi:alcohol dehydrogenase class IV
VDRAGWHGIVIGVPLQESAFSFTLQTHVWFGAGCRRELASLVSREGWQRVGLVVDHGLRQVPAVQELVDGLAPSRVTAMAWCDVSEPTYDALDEMRHAFDHRACDVVVGIGGGSALDSAKAMAVLAHNREPAVTYRGFDKFTGPVLPVVAIPTTAGTGSEVTPNASFVDTREQRKLGINGEAIRPKFALLDPELTVSCPRLPTLSAGADSMVHATEAYVARKATPLARMFAREGFRRVFNALPAVLADGSNLAARSDVMFGAFLAGIALMNSGTGPAAAMSYPTGVHFRVPHGVGGAMFLPIVAQHNVHEGYFDYGDLHAEMAGARVTASPKDAAQGFVDRLRETWVALGVPSLREFGVTAGDVDRLVADTLQLQGALEQNPVSFGAAEITAAFLEQIRAA